MLGSILSAMACWIREAKGCQRASEAVARATGVALAAIGVAATATPPRPNNKAVRRLMAGGGESLGAIESMRCTAGPQNRRLAFMKKLRPTTSYVSTSTL